MNLQIIKIQIHQLFQEKKAETLCKLFLASEPAKALRFHAPQSLHNVDADFLEKSAETLCRLFCSFIPENKIKSSIVSSM